MWAPQHSQPTVVLQHMQNSLYSISKPYRHKCILIHQLTYAIYTLVYSNIIDSRCRYLYILYTNYMHTHTYKLTIAASIECWVYRLIKNIIYVCICIFSYKQHTHYYLLPYSYLLSDYGYIYIFLTFERVNHYASSSVNNALE